MRHHLFFSLAATVAAGGLFLVLTGLAGACGDTAGVETRDDERDAAFSRDGGLVEVPEGGGASDAGTSGPPPSCENYCDLVMGSCTDADVQYGSRDECLSFCNLLPLGKASEKGESTVGCRELYAGGPAKTDSVAYCAAAGPFGGNLCGDRCSAFCQLTLAACSPEAGTPAYGSYADCQTACAQLVYADAGGDGLGGPQDGDTLNCRLYYLREAISDSSACASIAGDSGPCR